MPTLNRWTGTEWAEVMAGPIDHDHGADYEAAGAVATHAGLADPHAGYVLESLVNAAGDLIVGTADNTVTRLAKGAALDVLRVNTGGTALEWAAASGGGGITGQGAGTNSVLIGDSAAASADQSTALGDFAVASSDGAIAIGSGTNATSAPQALTGQGAIAIGASNGAAINGARATNWGSVALGSGTGSIVGASASGDASIAISPGAAAPGAYGIAIGHRSAASANFSIAVGLLANAASDRTIALGFDADATSSKSLAVGAYAQATTGTKAIAIGSGEDNDTAPNATAAGAIAIGASDAGKNGARASGANSIALGSGDAFLHGASATHADSVAIGKGSATTAANQIRLGTAAETVNIPGRVIGGAPNSALADASLAASQWTAYLDETGNTLTFKVKYAGGTVKVGTVALV